MKAKQAWFLALPAFLFLVGMTGVASGQYNEDISCFHCHSREVSDFQKSVHFNSIKCTNCHGGEVNAGGQVVSISVMYKNFSGVPTRTNITSLCSKCHGEATRLYKESIHWKELEKGVAIAATCTDCHGAHEILPSNNPNSPANPENVPLLCAKCHENQTKMSAWYYGIKTDRFDTYKKSYHYKAYISSGKVLATCSDCHENHDTRPASDPKSATNQMNLPTTCGKTNCHPGASNAVFYGGKVHEGQSVDLYSIDVKKLVNYFYIIMILFELTLTFGLIFLGISSKYELRRRH